jgi:hypothetical protein
MVMVRDAAAMMRGASLTFARLMVTVRVAELPTPTAPPSQPRTVNV